MNITVTSNWIWADRAEDPTPEFFQKHGFERANLDLVDIHAADAVVLDLLDGYGRRGGMMYEAGYARGLGKPVFSIGPREDVFSQLIPNWSDWEEMTRFLLK